MVEAQPGIRDKTPDTKSKYLVLEKKSPSSSFEKSP
jgi:hypothetical protein